MDFSCLFILLLHVLGTITGSKATSLAVKHLKSYPYQPKKWPVNGVLPTRAKIYCKIAIQLIPSLFHCGKLLLKLSMPWFFDRISWNPPSPLRVWARSCTWTVGFACLILFTFLFIILSNIKPQRKSTSHNHTVISPLRICPTPLKCSMI